MIPVFFTLGNDLFPLVGSWTASDKTSLNFLFFYLLWFLSMLPLLSISNPNLCLGSWSHLPLLCLGPASVSPPSSACVFLHSLLFLEHLQVSPNPKKPFLKSQAAVLFLPVLLNVLRICTNFLFLRRQLLSSCSMTSPPRRSAKWPSRQHRAFVAPVLHTVTTVSTLMTSSLFLPFKFLYWLWRHCAVRVLLRPS